MNCPDCGNPLEKNAQFCPKCFARIEPPTLWRKILSLFQSPAKPRRPVINLKKSVTIKTTDPDGLRHEYHSLDEVPPELRAEFEKLESEALKEIAHPSSSGGLAPKVIIRKAPAVYKVKDASGNERIYHSLEELPPEIRAAFEKAQSQSPE